MANNVNELLYSISKDCVFCFYCKLFGFKNNLLVEEGLNDWQHISHLLSRHEKSETHNNNLKSIYILHKL